MNSVRRFALLTIVVLRCDSVCHADQVYVHQRKGDSIRTFTGTIIDWNSRDLELTTSTGRLRKLSTELVTRVTYGQNDSHASGNDSFLKRAFLPAIESFEQAVYLEKRDWVRRRKLAICYGAMGQPVAAAESFQRILSTDAATQYLDALPLVWMTVPTDSRELRAEQWIAPKHPPALNLLGASWLLSGGKQQAAIRMLQQLARDADSRVSGLAEAQLWRIQVVLAQEDDFERWQTAIDRMDSSLRSGPIFLLARAQSQKETTHAAAMINFMRLPILYPENVGLASKALLEAGQLLEQGQQPHQAVLLYREITREFPETAAADVATKRLKHLGRG